METDNLCRERRIIKQSHTVEELGLNGMDLEKFSHLNAASNCLNAQRCFKALYFDISEHLEKSEN